FWEKRYNRHRCGLRCTRILSGTSRSPGREVSDGGNLGIPGRINKENIFFARTRSGLKESRCDSRLGPGKFSDRRNECAGPVRPGFVGAGLLALVSAHGGGGTGLSFD
ncbi:MAG: hypothetical protein Q7U51_06875, partial [Methanoregula sp.]|nr:hypothetical protein [Methanoregula sp.]